MLSALETRNKMLVNSGTTFNTTPVPPPESHPAAPTLACWLSKTASAVIVAPVGERGLFRERERGHPGLRQLTSHVEHLCAPSEGACGLYPRRLIRVGPEGKTASTDGCGVLSIP